MHELSIADALVKQVEALVAREGAVRALSVVVEVGSRSGVDPDALSAAFPFVAEMSTPVAGAGLEVRSPQGVTVCADCGAPQDDAGLAVCAKCGSAALERTGSRDLTLRSVELEFA